MIFLLFDALGEYMLVFSKTPAIQEKFHDQFNLKNRYSTHRFAIRAIPVFRVKFTVEDSSHTSEPILIIFHRDLRSPVREITALSFDINRLT